MIASICPRLYPVHIALKSATDRQRNLDLLTAVFRLYLTLAKTTGHKLDEGLSNFAFSPEGGLYYLDDEYYSWDGFNTFSVMLGVYIRSFNWFDTAFIEEMGSNLSKLLQTVFQDTECQILIAGQLQSVFMPNAEKEQLLKILINTLLQPPKTEPAPISVMDTKQAAVFKRPAMGRFFALLGDIHANYPALDCVLNYLKEEHIHTGIVLGDIVGYGPEPKECIERLQDCPFLIIKGNHDHAVATGDMTKGFSTNAKTVVNWTINELSADYRRWLNGLPSFIQQDEWYAVHGSPMDAEYFYAYVYMMTYQDNLNFMQQNNMALCFHGHSHMPGVFARYPHQYRHELGKTISLSGYQQALVCPGSVGQPRNGRPESQFAIYDREQRQITFMGLPYDNGPVIAKMRQLHLPEDLSLRLLKGC